MMVAPREKAILQTAEIRAIDYNHRHMIKFKNRSDPFLARVMGSLNRLIPRALEWGGVTLSRTSQPQPRAEGVRILSLDGGGVKGLFSALVLEAVMEAVRRIDTPNNHDAPKPCDYFDLICGTSTGGLLAIMLGRLRMDVRSCTNAYRRLSRDIFKKTVWSFPGKQWWDAYWDKPWFSGRKLEEATQNLLVEYLTVQQKNNLEVGGISPRDAPLRPTGPQDDANTCRTFVCALPGGERQCHRFRSYMPYLNLSGTDCKIWEAARATSAAPLYFPPMSIGEIVYFDGGMASNNPILEAVREAGQEYPMHSIAAIVSIGTGSTAPSPPGGGLFSLINSVVQRVTDTEAKHNEFLEQFPGLRNTYFRLQEENRLGVIDLAACEKLAEIEQISRAYINSARGQADIGKCAEKLARNM
jgi:predicted acylesterase/phospholipase RssA